MGLTLNVIFSQCLAIEMRREGTATTWDNANDSTFLSILFLSILLYSNIGIVELRREPTKLLYFPPK